MCFTATLCLRVCLGRFKQTYQCALNHVFFSIVSHILVLWHSVCWFLLIREHFWNIFVFFTEIYTHFGINQTLPRDFSDVTDFCFNSTKSLLRLLLLLIIIILLTLLEKPLQIRCIFFSKPFPCRISLSALDWSCAFLWTTLDSPTWHVPWHALKRLVNWGSPPTPVETSQRWSGLVFCLFLRRWPGGWWTHPNVSWTWFIWLISNKHNVKCHRINGKSYRFLAITLFLFNFKGFQQSTVNVTLTLSPLVTEVDGVKEYLCGSWADDSDNDWGEFFWTRPNRECCMLHSAVVTKRSKSTLFGRCTSICQL